MKQRTVLILSIVAGLFAFLLTRQYFAGQQKRLDEERERFYAGVHQIHVLAAIHDLPAGTVLKESDLADKTSYERDVGKNTILMEDVNRIIGKRLKFSLGTGETLQWAYVDVPYYPGGGLGAIITPKMRALSVNVSGAAAVSGLVQPNDRVDVLGTFFLPTKTAGELEAVTLTLLQDVTVLAVGQHTARLGEAAERGSASGYSTVTFEITSQEAELLVFTETMRGRLTLTLRNPADVSYESTLPSINFEQVQKVLPDLNTYRQTTIRQKGRSL